MKSAGGPEGGSGDDVELGGGELLDDSEKAVDEDCSVWNRKRPDLTLRDVENCTIRRGIKGFRGRMGECLQALRRVRGEIGREAAVVRESGGILFVGDEMEESDAVVSFEEEANPFWPSACKKSHGVFFQPRIRHSDDEVSFQKALGRLMEDFEEPEAGIIVVEQDDVSTASEDYERMDHKGRRVLTQKEVEAIKIRAERNYRRRRSDGGGSPAYGLELRDGDRLCVLPDGRTLEEYLAQLAKEAGSMPILKGRYTQLPTTRRVRVGYREYIEEGVGGVERNVMSMLADKLNKTRIVQPSKLVDAVFLGDKGEYDFRKVTTKDDLIEGDVCVVLFFSKGGLPAYRKACDVVEDINLVGKLIGTSDDSLKIGVVTEIEEKEYRDGSGKCVNFTFMGSDVELMESSFMGSDVELMESSLSGSGIEVKGRNFDVSYSVKYDKKDDGSRVERCEEPFFDVVFKIVKKQVKEV